jgi:hypothetical protein
MERNIIVDTSVSGDFTEYEPNMLDHTIWVREVIFRIILERLDFAGAYRSWLRHDEQYRFPECIPMQDWVRLCEAESRVLG